VSVRLFDSKKDLINHSMTLMEFDKRKENQSQGLYFLHKLISSGKIFIKVSGAEGRVEFFIFTEYYIFNYK